MKDINIGAKGKESTYVYRKCFLHPRPLPDPKVIPIPDSNSKPYSPFFSRGIVPETDLKPSSIPDALFPAPTMDY